MTLKLSFILSLLIVNTCFGQEKEAQIINKGVPETIAFEPFDSEYYSKYFASSYFFEIDKKVVSIRARGGVLHNKLELRLTNPEDGTILSYTEEIIEPREVYFETIEQIDNIIYAFYSEYNNLKNQETYNAFVITIENNEFQIEDRKEIIIIEGKTNSEAKYNPAVINHTNKGKFELNYNTNYKKFIIKFSPKRSGITTEKRNEKIGLVVLDKELTITHESLTELPEAFLNIIDYTVDAQNNIYLITQHEALAISPKNDHFELAKITVNGDFSTQEIKFEQYIADIRFAQSTNGSLNVVGYYKVEKKKRPIKGIFTYSINNDKLSTVTLHDFSFDFLAQYKGISAKKKKKLESKFNEDQFGIHQLSVHSIIANADGSILIIGQRESSNTITTPGKPNSINPNAHPSSPGTVMTGPPTSGTNTSSTPIYEELFVSKLDVENQKVIWNSKIPRSDATNELYIGNTNDYLYFVFPDNPKNAQLQDEDEINSDNSIFNKSLVLFQVDIATGDKNRYQLSENGVIAEQKPDKVNSSCMLILSDDQFIIELAYKKDKFGYFKAAL